MKKKLNMNLQFFAEPGSEPTGGQGEPAPQPGANQTPPATDPPQPQIDYNKIQQMLDGTLAAKENTALKAYFKQQGLSQEEAEQAMQAKHRSNPERGTERAADGTESYDRA